MTTGFSFKPLWVRLEAAQKHLIDELEQLKANSQGRSPWAKEDERAIEISEVERRSALEKGLRDQLAEIEHALCKRDQGTYGLCDNCGQPIDLDRLQALPQANLCLSCKARQAKNASGRIKEGLGS
jgi:DnaK suppressor protein